MKLKIFVATATTSLFLLTANAQVSKNTWMAGGLVQYTSNKFEQGTPQGFNNKQRSAIVDLSVGYVFRDNQVLGLVATYAPSRYTTSSASGGGKLRSDTKGVGAFYRAYKPLNNKFYVYGQATALYTRQKMTADGIWLHNSKANTGSLSIAPGISYAILKNVQLELSIPNLVQLSYSKSKANIPTTTVTQEKEDLKLKSSLSSGLLKELGLGFKIFF